MDVEHFCFVIVSLSICWWWRATQQLSRLVTCCRIAASSVLLWCLNSSLEARVTGAAARSSTVAQHHPLVWPGCWRLHAGGDGERCTILGTLSCEAPGWPHLPPPPASTDVTTTTVHTTQPTVARLLLCGRICTLSSHSSTFSDFLMYCILYIKGIVRLNRTMINSLFLTSLLSTVLLLMAEKLFT